MGDHEDNGQYHHSLLHYCKFKEADVDNHGFAHPQEFDPYLNLETTEHWGYQAGSGPLFPNRSRKWHRIDSP